MEIGTRLFGAGILALMVGCATVPAEETEAGPGPAPEEVTGPPTAGAPAPPPAPPAPPAPQTPATTSVMDGVYTTAQAQRGETIAQQECVICHSPQGEWTNFLALWGGSPLLAPFDQIRTTMPQHNPGGLTRDQYAAIIAYIPSLNGVPAGGTELPGTSEALERIVVPRG